MARNGRLQRHVSLHQKGSLASSPLMQQDRLMRFPLALNRIASAAAHGAIGVRWCSLRDNNRNNNISLPQADD